MKILFLTERSDNNVGVFNYHGLERAIHEITDWCEWAGPGWGLHRPGESVNDTIKRVMPDADLVVCPRETLIDAGKIRARTCIMITDLHGKHNWGLKNPIEFATALNKARYNIVFSRYKEVHGSGVSPQIFPQILGDKFKWLPWSMDPDYYYRFKGEPKNDLLFLGSVHPSVYPLRYSMATGFTSFCNRNNLSSYMSQGIGIPVWEAKIDELEAKGFPVGSNYAQLLGTSRAILFGNSKFKYPLQKNFEVRASGCLAVSDAPVGAEELGFNDGVDYVEVSPDNWRTKIHYYLENWDIGKKVAARGRQLFLERHTHRIRARQIIDMLKG